MIIPLSRRTTRLAIALALVGATAAVSGCSGSSGSGASSNSFTFTYASATSGDSPYATLAKSYESSHQGVTITLNQLPNDSYAQTVLTQVQSGNAPDVMLANAGSGETNGIIPMERAGLLAPLDDSAKVLVPKGSESQFTVDDKIYGLPMGITVSGLVVAGAGLEPLGLSPFPTTIDQLIAQCGSLTQKGVSFVVLAGAAAPNTSLAALTIAAGAVYADQPDWNEQRAAGDVTFAGTAGWKTTLNTIVELNSAGCFQPGAQGAGFDTITNSLSQQTAVGAFIPGNSVSQLVDAAPSANWQIEPFPTTSGKPFGLVNSGSALAVPAQAKNKSAAQAFVNWVGEPAQVSQYAELSGSLPTTGYQDLDFSKTIYAPVSDILKNQEFTTLPSASWPNPTVNDALANGVQGLLTGQKTADQVLTDMDDAWGQ